MIAMNIDKRTNHQLEYINARYSPLIVSSMQMRWNEFSFWKRMAFRKGRHSRRLKWKHILSLKVVKKGKCKYFLKICHRVSLMVDNKEAERENRIFSHFFDIGNCQRVFRPKRSFVKLSQETCCMEMTIKKLPPSKLLSIILSMNLFFTKAFATFINLVNIFENFIMIFLEWGNKSKLGKINGAQFLENKNEMLNCSNERVWVREKKSNFWFLKISFFRFSSGNDLGRTLFRSTRMKVKMLNKSGWNISVSNIKESLAQIIISFIRIFNFLDLRAKGASDDTDSTMNLLEHKWVVEFNLRQENSTWNNLTLIKYFFNSNFKPNCYGCTNVLIFETWNVTICIQILKVKHINTVKFTLHQCFSYNNEISLISWTTLRHA